MPVTAVIGAQWGDEGKGKIVDYLAQEMDFVIRANGGDNAGHTVINEKGEFKLHLIPSGIFNERAISIIGNGVAVNPASLVKEILELQSKGIDVSPKNLAISQKAHLIMPWHLLLDGIEEEARGSQAIGTTRKGIGPCFADKYARKGLRVGDLFDEKKFREKLAPIYREKEKILAMVYDYYDLQSASSIIYNYLSMAEIIAPYAVQTESVIWRALESDKNILLEGAQGSSLDIDFGTYPDVTSSICGVAGLAQGSGIQIQKIQKIIGVAKVYTTRVGSKNQLFPTEMEKELGDSLREKAHEYGATTGRPRRIGWFDPTQVSYNAMINGFTELALTRLDNLSRFRPLKISIATTSEEKPLSVPIWDGEPVLFEVAGWDENIEGCRRFEDLPQAAKDYVLKIEELVGVPVKKISTGPRREDIILLGYRV